MARYRVGPGQEARRRSKARAEKWGWAEEETLNESDELWAEGTRLAQAVVDKYGHLYDEHGVRIDSKGLPAHTQEELEAGLLQALQEAGFDKTHRDDNGHLCLACSQCEALVICNVATHEDGCPNYRRALVELDEDG